MLGRACVSLPLALLGAHAASGVELFSEFITRTRPPETLGTGQCLPCQGLFARLEEAPDGELQQSSQIELRGEPKSGTRFSWGWAHGLLEHTCEHLKHTYGDKTCRIERTRDETHLTNLTLVFEPGLAGSDGLCSCEGISRVEVAASTRFKHSFPVPESCRWKHDAGIAKAGEGCGSVNGRPVENASDLWLCMKEASCEYSDDSLQFAAMRDPRAVAVSTHFHVNSHIEENTRHPSLVKSLDEAVLLILPQICQFTTIRHILFDGQLSDRSTIFWYEDAMRDPLGWHYRWASFAGFTLPARWIEDIHATLPEWQQDAHRDRHPSGLPTSCSIPWLSRPRERLHPKSSPSIQPPTVFMPKDRTAMTRTLTVEANKLSACDRDFFL
ncbi:unnamed protein product, partial [Ectocarpus sp. 12 AP-2014]